MRCETRIRKDSVFPEAIRSSLDDNPQPTHLWITVYRRISGEAIASNPVAVSGMLNMSCHMITSTIMACQMCHVDWWGSSGKDREDEAVL
jgi:hypothetical protein